MGLLKKIKSFILDDHRYVFLGTSVVAVIGILFSMQVRSPRSFLASAYAFEVAVYYYLVAWLVLSAVALVMKLTHWYSFNAGMAPIVIGMFFLGAVQLLFIGLMGEYVLNINQRVMNRPLVIEEERLNFGPAPAETLPAGETAASESGDGA